jgi:hypothetical protein
VLDHVHAFAKYVENGGAVAWWIGYARGPNVEIDVCFRVIGPEYRDTATTVRVERVGSPKPFRYRGGGARTSEMSA